MSATVVRALALGSRSDWRNQATCTECGWAGGRYTSADTAERQARRHDEENHQEGHSDDR